MIKIDIKPLSVNECWKGKRYRTDKYKSFEYSVIQLIRSQDIKLIIPDGKLWIMFEFGFSNSRADLDNPEKLIIDILSKYYGFNDNRIYCKTTIKNIVPKGQEYIKFNIESLKID